MFYFGIFELEFENNIVISDNKHSQNCLIAKFFENIHVPKCDPKNSFFEYF